MRATLGYNLVHFRLYFQLYFDLNALSFLFYGENTNTDPFPAGGGNFVHL